MYRHFDLVCLHSPLHVLYSVCSHAFQCYPSNHAQTMRPTPSESQEWNSRELSIPRSSPLIKTEWLVY